MIDRRKEEFETGIDFLDVEKEAHITTSSPVMMRRYDKLAEKYPQFRKVAGDELYASYHCPKEWVSVRPPKKMKMTDEKRAELSERARKNFGYAAPMESEADEA